MQAADTLLGCEERWGRPHRRPSGSQRREPARRVPQMSRSPHRTAGRGSDARTTTTAWAQARAAPGPARWRGV